MEDAEVKLMASAERWFEILRASWHVLVFIIGATIGICFWLANLSATLDKIQTYQQQIKNSQRLLRFQLCHYTAEQKGYDKGLRSSIYWLDRQVQSTNQLPPDIPDLPDGEEYCPEFQQQNENMQPKPGVDSSIPASIILNDRSF